MRYFFDAQAIIIWDDYYNKELIETQRSNGASPQIFTWEEFTKLASSIDDHAINERQASIRPGECATVIHTSGTTGPPKAVMLSHDNLLWTVQTTLKMFPEIGDNERVLSYLPLSHIAAQMVDNYIMMNVGGCAYFTSPADIRNNLVKEMKKVKPTLFLGVPRVWEKLVNRLREVEAQRSGIKGWLLSWAKSVAAPHAEMLQFNNTKGEKKARRKR